MSGYVVLGHGPAMFFEVRNGRVWRTSPRMPQARGWAVARLRGHFRARRCTIYAVTRQAS